MKNIVKMQASRKDDDDGPAIVSPMSITALQSEGDSLVCIPSSATLTSSENDRLPPININILKEMSVESLSKNLQVRHDLVLDEDCRVQNTVQGHK